MAKTKIYFASDFHLGLPDYEKSLSREKSIVRWLDEIKNDALEIYLLGDIFDFWFEYKTVVPRGFTRFLGKLSELTDSGIKIHFFVGNHDLWIFDYLPKETGVIIHRKPLETTLLGKKFYLAHGDGLGPGDKGFKSLKKVFTSKIAQWLFARIHPNASVSFAKNWSRHSRMTENPKTYEFKGEDKEWLILHSKEILKTNFFDFFIYGHRHIPTKLKLENNSTYINLGDWIMNFTYAEYDGNTIELRKFKK